MSIQMAAARLVLRVRYKPRGVRASYERLKRVNLPDSPKRVARRHDVRVVDVGGTRAVWLDENRRHQGTIVYLHGGSYITGPQKEQWEWFARLCEESDMAGVLVDYALTPKHAFPVALEQVLGMVKDLKEPWFLAGDSAGGGLALAAAYRLRSGGETLPRAIVLSSPWLDVTMSNPQARLNQSIDSMLSLRGLARGAEPYAAGADPRDPLISPIFGEPSGLPPMQIHVGTRELFLWDCREWQARCRQSGVPCELIEVPGGFHDFPMAVSLIPEARAAVKRQAKFLRSHLSEESG